MREDVNHSMPENRGLFSKAMAVYRHVSSSEFCDLDIVGRLVVYLFFQFLTLDDRKKDEDNLEDGLTFEALTELAYRARWMEKISEMEGKEVFSFILSLRDTLCSSRMDPPEPIKSFCSSLGMELDEDDIFDIFPYIWHRKISNYFTGDDVKLVEKVLDVSEGDFILLESDTLPGTFMGIGSETNLEAMICIRNDLDRVLGKMILFMLIPRDKWKARKVVKQLPAESPEGPNKIISFSAMEPLARGGRNSADGFDSTMAVIAPMIERGANAVFLANASFLSFGHGNARRCRKQLFDLDAHLSVMSFGRGRCSIIVLDKTRSDRDKLLLSDLSDMDARGALAMASFITCDRNIPEAFRGHFMNVSRDEVKANDFMLYPAFYRDLTVRETKGLDEIEIRLREKYSELKRLADLMSD